jgi:Skp family chaperone for outer membrane proteins
MIRIPLAAFLTAVMTTGAAWAQTPPTQQTPPPPPQTPPADVPFPAEAKIGFVNFQNLVAMSTFGKQGLQKLEALGKQKEGELTGLQTQVTTLQQEIQTQASVLTPQVLQQKQSQLQNLQGQLQLAQQSAQNELSMLENELLDEFEGKALPIINAIREEKGLWFVLAIQDGGGLAVVSAMNGLNLTPEVARRMDAADAGG